jgi:hypothetical protein
MPVGGYSVMRFWLCPALELDARSFDGRRDNDSARGPTKVP